MGIDRALTDSELAAITTAITAAETVTDALITAIKDPFVALLADEGKSWDDFSETNPLVAMDYHIPKGQLMAIWNVAQDRVQALAGPFGGESRVHVALQLMNQGVGYYET